MSIAVLLIDSVYRKDENYYPKGFLGITCILVKNIFIDF